MIELLYGESIYGYDFFYGYLYTTDNILWLQRENSNDKLILIDNKSYDFGNIDMGLPKVKIDIQSVAGVTGGVMVGIPEVNNREFSFDFIFKGNDTISALNSERTRNINKWFLYDKENPLYLYYHIKDDIKTYKIEVIPSINKESYSNIRFSKNISVSLTSEKSYFENIVETINTTTTTTEKTTVQIDNTGIETPFVLELTPVLALKYIEVKNDYNYGFMSYFSFPANQIIKIFEDGSANIGNILVNNMFTSGTIFNLKKGLNNLYITTQSQDGEVPVPMSISIKYREKIL